jgi:hypothetical protein
MKDRTLEILNVTLKTDETVTPAQRKKIFEFCARGEASPVPIPDGIGRSPLIFSRAETGKTLGGKTTRWVDMLCRKGLLKKFVPPGNKRSIGITAESLHQFISGK